MAEHRIDNLPFSFLKGEVPPYAPVLETIERKGRSGVIRRDVGKQGIFSLISVNAVPDYNNSTAALRAFAAKKESGAVPLIKDDYEYINDNLLVVVVEVQPIVQQQRKLIIGGLSPNQYFELRARWDLRFVEIEAA